MAVGGQNGVACVCWLVSMLGVSSLLTSDPSAKYGVAGSVSTSGAVSVGVSASFRKAPFGTGMWHSTDMWHSRDMLLAADDFGVGICSSSCCWPPCVVDSVSVFAAVVRALVSAAVVRSMISVVAVGALVSGGSSSITTVELCVYQAPSVLACSDRSAASCFGGVMGRFISACSKKINGGDVGAVFGSGDGEAGIAGRDDRDVVAIRGGGIICSGVVGAATGTAFAGVTPVAAASTGGWFAFGGCVPADRTALIEPLAFLTSLPVYEPLACATSVPPPAADENFDAAPSTLAPYRSSC